MDVLEPEPGVGIYYETQLYVDHPTVEIVFRCRYDVR